MLKRLYEDDKDSPIDSDDNFEEKDDDEIDSVDFEQQLKKEVIEMVEEKLNNFEMRLKYIIEEHNKECKSEFKVYEQHIKE